MPSGCCVLFLGGVPMARAAELPPAVSQALQEAGIPSRSVGVVVQAVMADRRCSATTPARR
jgi:hypothetical protein